MSKHTLPSALPWYVAREEFLFFIICVLMPSLFLVAGLVAMWAGQ